MVMADAVSVNGQCAKLYLGRKNAALYMYAVFLTPGPSAVREAHSSRHNGSSIEVPQFNMLH